LVKGILKLNVASFVWGQGRVYGKKGEKKNRASKTQNGAPAAADAVAAKLVA
jgi:hypothetical protein